MGGLSTDSIYRTPSTPKSEVKTAANPSPTPVKVKSVVPSSGFTALPVVQPAEYLTADYYRYGKGSSGAGDASYEPGISSRVIAGFDEDEQESSLRVFGVLPGGNSEGDLIPGYTKFILEGSNEAESERVQISETFGDAYYFFYGKRPSVYNYTATLINAKNANWVSDFMFYYENYLRGTRCAELRARVIMTYGGRQVEGFMLNCAHQTNAITEQGVRLSFQLAITSRKTLGFSNDFGISVDAFGVEVIDDTLRAVLNQIAGPEGTGSSDPATSEAINSTKSTMLGNGSAVSMIA